MKSGPQRYPGATTGAHWYQDNVGGSAMESNVGVIHTTEGRTVPGYRGGLDAPNFTALPDIKARKLRWYQHFDFDVSSRALVNMRGGVETNTLNAVQVELVGTCDERNAKTWGGKKVGVDYLFWPDAPDWALAELAKFVRWAHDKHGLPMQSSVTWKAYKKGQVGGSYGANGVRLSAAAWTRYYGWLGHQHVPENSHGDPGNLDFAHVLELAEGATTSTYTVRKGDTLSTIAKAKLGRAARWPEIAELNGLKAPYTIHVAQELKLPKK
ncbi:LysM peptidoglycan-binding domain-containing protein [Streptomyces sp. NPDC058644]|uniref:LysM peptidoglycan-binding domain-containing protein n=1 Tax=unclassified Streptomyces TaxID=2593676 RepID=UPI003652057E